MTDVIPMILKQILRRSGQIILVLIRSKLHKSISNNSDATMENFSIADITFFVTF